MAKAAEIRTQVTFELERRRRLAVPAFAGGVLYLLSQIIISGTLNGAPTVGLVQGIEPALKGVADPVTSPRADEVKFISHHAFALIAGSVVAAIALVILVAVLLFLFEAARFRRSEIFAPARALALFGGIGFAIVAVAHQVVGAVLTHKFAMPGHDHSSHAVEQALTKGTANLAVQYLSLLAGLALAAGTVATMMAAQRVGLVPRWLGFLGMFTGILLFIPIGGAQLGGLIPAFFLVMMGILLIGKWPGGDPPAWEAGEARPWPTAAEQRAARERAAGKLTPVAAGAGAAGSPAAAPPAPEPKAPTTSRSQRRKRRKSGGKH
jgi:hypothetical protein